MPPPIFISGQAAVVAAAGRHPAAGGGIHAPPAAAGSGPIRPSAHGPASMPPRLPLGAASMPPGSTTRASPFSLSAVPHAPTQPPQASGKAIQAIHFAAIVAATLRAQGSTLVEGVTTPKDRLSWNTYYEPGIGQDFFEGKWVEPKGFRFAAER